MKKPTFDQIQQWWDNLTKDEQTQHEKSYGIYGHDQGTDLNDIIGMYYIHHNIKGDFHATGSMSINDLT